MSKKLTVERINLADFASEEQAKVYCNQRQIIGLVTTCKIQGYTDTDPIKITVSRGSRFYNLHVPKISGLYYLQ